MICKDEEYSPLFHELFKPVGELQQLIDYHLDKLGGRGNYISCTFRFCQLLGDFKEHGFILAQNERKAYINRCIDAVIKLHEDNHDKSILVTADSHTFLESLNERHLPFVYIMPGRVVHIGFTPDASKSTYMKSFLDMYMLSYAQTVYQVRDRLLMCSSFPIRAALLGKKKYMEIPL